MRDIVVKKTLRGFHLVEFNDIYGTECSMQDSSLASKAAIWLGPNTGNPQMFYPNTKEPWRPYKLSEGVSISTRMHLDRDGVRELISYLQHFLDEGFTPSVPLPPTEKDPKLVECSKCGGEGTNMVGDGFGGTSQWSCSRCDGTGWVTEEMAAIYLKENSNAPG